jgi:TonB-dependent receptor
MRLDTGGALAGFDAATVTRRYVEVLPGLHLRYEPVQGLLYRASITRSMSRPSPADLAPYRTLSFFDHRGRAGTPTLKPYLATNVDLSVDRYHERYGLLSATVFYKKIDHFIADTQQSEQVGALGSFIVFRRVNGDAAWASGLELSWQSQNLTLPAKLGRGALTVNYSFNHGEAHQPLRPGVVFPLPRQVVHQASTHFTVTRGRLTLDANVSYRSGWWEDLIAPDLDNFIASAWDAELSGGIAFGKGGRVTFGASNLLNRPTRHYAGLPGRMNDWQLNGIDYTVGLQWKR